MPSPLSRSTTLDLRRLLCPAMGLLLSAPAWAHGPSPAIIGVAAAGEGGPQVLQLSAGLATRGPDGWTWLCGAAWGGPPSPLAASSDGATTFVAAADGLRAITGTSVSEPVLPDVNAATALVLDAGAHVWALTRQGGATRLWRVGTSAPVWESPDGTWTGFALHDGHPVVGRVAADGLHVLTIAVDGAEVGEATLPASPGATVTLRSAGALYAVLRTGSTSELARVDASLVSLATDKGAIHGPVLAGGSAVVVIGGELRTISGDETVPWDAARTYTCLARAGGEAFACAQKELFAVADAVTGPVVTLATLLPPPEALVPEAQRESCQSQWSHFASEAGVPPDPGTDDATAAAPTGDEGCAASTGGATRWAALLGLLVVRRRRRGAPRMDEQIRG
ncbi:MAG: hypothetical protein AMXMBFR64_03270 [Myxococcales bacterium]